MYQNVCQLDGKQARSFRREYVLVAIPYLGMQLRVFPLVQTSGVPSLVLSKVRIQVDAYGQS